eukprot:ANDGO_07855.mRNA.1 hypothetical protein
MKMEDRLQSSHAVYTLAVRESVSSSVFILHAVNPGSVQPPSGSTGTSIDCQPLLPHIEPLLDASSKAVLPFPPYVVKDGVFIASHLRELFLLRHAKESDVMQEINKLRTSVVIGHSKLSQQEFLSMVTALLDKWAMSASDLKTVIEPTIPFFASFRRSVADRLKSISEIHVSSDELGDTLLFYEWIRFARGFQYVAYASNKQPWCSASSERELEEMRISWNSLEVSIEQEKERELSLSTSMIRSLDEEISEVQQSTSNFLCLMEQKRELLEYQVRLDRLSKVEMRLAEMKSLRAEKEAKLQSFRNRLETMMIDHAEPPPFPLSRNVSENRDVLINLRNELETKEHHLFSEISREERADNEVVRLLLEESKDVEIENLYERPKVIENGPAKASAGSTGISRPAIPIQARTGAAGNAFKNAIPSASDSLCRDTSDSEGCRLEGFQTMSGHDDLADTANGMDFDDSIDELLVPEPMPVERVPVPIGINSVVENVGVGDDSDVEGSHLHEDEEYFYAVDYQDGELEEAPQPLPEMNLEIVTFSAEEARRKAALRASEGLKKLKSQKEAEELQKQRKRDEQFRRRDEKLKEFLERQKNKDQDLIFPGRQSSRSAVVELERPAWDSRPATAVRKPDG